MASSPPDAPGLPVPEPPPTAAPDESVCVGCGAAVMLSPSPDALDPRCAAAWVCEQCGRAVQPEDSPYAYRRWRLGG